ncbi:hypothetical protein CEUSTIGMA_g8706.t1 [Chlamydomonas eustigma]|uniref:Uncharacterized protein n=1 Tax=Chlamydomonas eustigma TaxID=1157962 RepID=A0A250XDX8_9CHLO|nr:hypothetical protein CEUSTIGMA_g8706.t1 [Chlamydomonas eustigma]|eukprot:GAX81274.1 hypothetical protein CEUSTIGMA_g8706.t1 [Chlamydomonas eustigma]
MFVVILPSHLGFGGKQLLTFDSMGWTSGSYHAENSVMKAEQYEIWEARLLTSAFIGELEQDRHRPADVLLGRQSTQEVARNFTDVDDEVETADVHLSKVWRCGPGPRLKKRSRRKSKGADAIQHLAVMTEERESSSSGDDNDAWMLSTSASCPPAHAWVSEYVKHPAKWTVLDNEYALIEHAASAHHFRTLHLVQRWSQSCKPMLRSEQCCVQAASSGCKASRTLLEIHGGNTRKILVRCRGQHNHPMTASAGMLDSTKLKQLQLMPDDVTVGVLLREATAPCKLAPAGRDLYGFPTGSVPDTSTALPETDAMEWTCQCYWRPTGTPLDSTSLEVCGKMHRASSHQEPSRRFCCQCLAPRWDGPHGQLRHRVRALLLQAGGLLLSAKQIHARLVEAALPSSSTIPPSADFKSKAPSITLPNSQSLKCGLLIPDIMDVKSELSCWIQEYHNQQLQDMLYGRSKRTDRNSEGCSLMCDLSNRNRATHKRSAPLKTAFHLGASVDRVLPLPVARLQGALNRLREDKERQTFQCALEQPGAAHFSNLPPQVASPSLEHTALMVQREMFRNKMGQTTPGHERMVAAGGTAPGPSSSALTVGDQQPHGGCSSNIRAAAGGAANMVMELMHQLYKPQSMAGGIKALEACNVQARDMNNGHITTHKQPWEVSLSLRSMLLSPQLIAPVVPPSSEGTYISSTAKMLARSERQQEVCKLVEAEHWPNDASALERVVGLLNPEPDRRTLSAATLACLQQQQQQQSSASLRAPSVDKYEQLFSPGKRQSSVWRAVAPNCLSAFQSGPSPQLHNPLLIHPRHGLNFSSGLADNIGETSSLQSVPQGPREAGPHGVQTAGPSYSSHSGLAHPPSSPPSSPTNFCKPAVRRVFEMAKSIGLNPALVQRAARKTADLVEKLGLHCKPQTSVHAPAMPSTSSSNDPLHNISTVLQALTAFAHQVPLAQRRQLQEPLSEPLKRKREPALAAVLGISLQSGTHRSKYQILSSPAEYLHKAEGGSSSPSRHTMQLVVGNEDMVHDDNREDGGHDNHDRRIMADDLDDYEFEEDVDLSSEAEESNDDVDEDLDVD